VNANIKVTIEGDRAMASNMKQLLSYRGELFFQRPLGFLFIFKNSSHMKGYSELTHIAGHDSADLSIEAEERIRAFRQKHFKD
jgi:hypothetical protein